MIGTGSQKWLDGINFLMDENGTGEVHHMLMQKGAWSRGTLAERDGQFWIAVLEV